MACTQQSVTRENTKQKKAFKRLEVGEDFLELENARRFIKATATSKCNLSTKQSLEMPREMLSLKSFEKASGAS